MVKLLAICNIWNGHSEVSGQNLAKAPRVVKRMKVDEKFVMGRMNYFSLNFRCRLTVGVVDCVTTLPAFTVVLSVEDERDILVDGGKGWV